MIQRGGKKQNRCSFRQSEEAARQAQEAARYLGLTVSELAATAVAAYVTKTRSVRAQQGSKPQEARRRQLVLQALGVRGRGNGA